MAIVKLTEDFISTQLHCPLNLKRIEFVSDERTGLYIEVRIASPGKGTYYLRYKDVKNKSCHQKIGITTTMSLQEAKLAAKKLKSEVTLGADPRADEKARLAVMTLNDLWTDHYYPFAKSTKRSHIRDEQLFRLRIQPKFGHLRLNQITRHQLQTFHMSLKDEGLAPASCDLHLKLLNRMLNLSVQWQYILSNPCKGVQQFNVDNRVELRLDDQQLAQLMHVLLTDRNQPICLIARFLLSTGARLSEVLQAKWSHIDRQNKLWKIPAANSKSKKIGTAPLNDTAIDILNLIGTEGKFEYVFINPKRGERYKNIHKAWERIRQDSGLPTLRIHDLRHAMATLLIESGRTLYEVQKILRHSDSKVTERYLHISDRKLHEAANSASVAISRAMQSKVEVV